MADISLKHQFHSLERTLYFYDGQAKVVGGVVTLPLDRPHWVTRAWQLGYTLDPETLQRREYANVLMILAGQTPEPAAPQEPEHEHTPVVDVTDPEAPKVVCSECEEVLDTDPETVEQSAESAEENTDEGTNGGGLPAGDDGLRPGPDEGANGVPEDGLDGGSSDGAPVLGEAD